jgi:SEC-C motif domain protein
MQQGDSGVVEFVARFRDLGQGGRAGRLHEISQFMREGGGAQARWLYVAGSAPASEG